MLTPMERLSVGREYLKLDRQQLMAKLFSDMAKRPGVDVDAVPLHRAMGRTDQDALYEGVAPEIRKVLDTSATALQRQDLEPILYALFVKVFPYWDRIAKEPSNGLVHAYNQITAPGNGANTVNNYLITELGTVTDDTSTYVRKTTNIAVMATRRGISIKEGHAVQQGGAPYNPEALEIQNGMTVLARTMQQLLFHGNSSGSGGDTDSAEAGLYTQNGFDGLRSILGGQGGNSGNNAVAVTQNGTSTTITAAIDNAAQLVMDNGGTPSVVVGSAAAQHAWIQEQVPQVRYNDPVEVVPGHTVPAINTLAGRLPFVTIPGGYVGSYTYNSATVEDVYVLDEGTISAPYLGSPTFTMLEIPIGANAQLSRLFILYGMFGLAVKAPAFNAKVRH